MAQSHHFVPQSYQRRFVDPATPDRQTPYVWVYDFSAAEWKRRAPKNVAASPDFYALPGREGKERHTLEHEPLAVIERTADAIYQRKIAQRLTLTDEEKEQYALFVALMMSRVPVFRERMNQLTAWPMMLRVKLMLNKPDLLARHMRAYEQATGHKAPTADDLRLLDEGTLRIEASQGQHLANMAYTLEAALPILAKMQWLFCHTRAPQWYIASDNPVTLRVPDHPEWGYGLARKDIQVQFPVSREVCLWIIWGKGADMHLDLPAVLEAEDGQRFDVPESFVNLANVQTMAYADKLLIAPSPNFPGADALPYKSGLQDFFNQMAIEDEDSSAEDE